MPAERRSEWGAMFVFTIALAINYLDRLLLSALQPTLESEFHLTAQDYGWLHSAFYAVYALGSPLAGMAIDRFGLNTSITWAVGLWSAAGIATGYTTGLSGLVGCRMWLAAAETAVIPGNGKATGLYVEPRRRAIGAAFGQIGLATGMAAAPLLASFVSPRYGWRAAFLVAGLLGFAWSPVWLWTARRVPPRQAPPPGPRRPAASVWKDRRIFLLMLANMLGMPAYYLWTTWTTKLLTGTYSLPQDEVNFKFAWLPPLFSVAGALAGGALSSRLASGGRTLVRSRLIAIAAGAAGLVCTALVPFAATASVATALICASFFWSLMFSVNVYSLPLDLFGPERAGSGVSALTGSFGLMALVISPVLGASVDRWGFAPACVVIGAMPLLAAAVLFGTLRGE